MFDVPYVSNYKCSCSICTLTSVLVLRIVYQKMALLCDSPTQAALWVFFFFAAHGALQSSFIHFKKRVYTFGGSPLTYWILSMHLDRILLENRLLYLSINANRHLFPLWDSKHIMWKMKTVSF